MNGEKTLSRAEQGIDDLSILLNISSEEVVEYLYDGFLLNTMNPTPEQLDMFNELENTFKGF